MKQPGWSIEFAGGKRAHSLKRPFANHLLPTEFKAHVPPFSHTTQEYTLKNLLKDFLQKSKRCREGDEATG